MAKNATLEGPAFLYAECNDTRLRCGSGEVTSLTDGAQSVLLSVLKQGAASPAELARRTGLPVIDAHTIADDLVRRQLLRRLVDNPALRASVEKLVAQQHAAYSSFLGTPRAKKLWNRLARQHDLAARRRQSEMGPPLTSVASKPATIATPTQPMAAGTDERRAKRDAQDTALLAELRSRALNPKALPPYENGHPSIKADLKKAIGSMAPFSSLKDFDNTWLRLRNQGQIKHSMAKN